MSDHPIHPRSAARGADTIPPLDAGQHREAEALLLRALEQLHARPLTAGQRKDMAQALSDQMAATSRLRAFALDNEDAPYVVPVSAGASRNG